MESTIIFPQVNTYLSKYQNPREADAMTKIQEELDETKIILVSKFLNKEMLFANFITYIHSKNFVKRSTSVLIYLVMEYSNILFVCNLKILFYALNIWYTHLRI